MTDTLESLLHVMFQAHPWHGVSPGERAPEEVTCFIEIVPGDGVKYELDKPSGHLRIDRPQRYSSQCPTLYGFVPQTYCGESVAARAVERGAGAKMVGDGDPLDVCVLTEKAIPRGDFLLRARPIGGLRMIDGEEADDKIVAVLVDDVAYGAFRELAALPAGIVDRLRHFFLSYKQPPPPAPAKVRIAEVYDRAEALEVIRRSVADYRARFGGPEGRVEALKKLLAG